MNLNEKSPEYLSLFIDEMLKKGVKGVRICTHKLIYICTHTLMGTHTTILILKHF